MGDFRQINSESINEAYKKLTLHSIMGQAFLAAVNSEKPLTNCLILNKIADQEFNDLDDLINVLDEPELLFGELEQLMEISETPETKQGFGELLELCRTYHTLAQLSDDFLFIPVGDFSYFAELMHEQYKPDMDLNEYTHFLASDYQVVSIDAPETLGYSGNLMYLAS